MDTNIRDFGAVADGCTLCTREIQAAIDACAQSGGGTVTVPAGQYVTGTIRLKSHVYLYLAPGSELLGSEHFSDYAPSKRGCAWNWHVDGWGGQASTQVYAMVLTENAVDCGITGHGTIDGRRSKKHGYTQEKGRPFLVVFSECTDILVSGVTLRNPGMHTVFSMNNTRVTVTGIRIHSRDSFNGDGIDFDGSRDVVITGCFLDTGDDAIGLKTLSPSDPCENFTISDCVITSEWAALRMGPESAGDMRHISMTNCVFNGCNDGFKLQPCEDYVMEDLVFSNITMRDVARPIFITQGVYVFSRYSHGSRPKPAAFRRACFSNITAVMRQPAPLEHGPVIQSCNFIYGQMDGECRDIYIHHVHLVVPGGGTQEDADRAGHAELLDYAESYPEVLAFMGRYPAAGFYIKNAENVRISDCSFTCANHDARRMIAAENVDELRISQVSSYNCAGLLRHYRCDGLRVNECEGDVEELRGEMAESWERARKLAQETSDLFAASARAVDRVDGLAPAEKIPCGETAISYQGGAVLLVARRFQGELRILVNDEAAFTWAPPVEYAFRTDVGADISAFLRDGENAVEVQATEKDGTPVQLELYNLS